MKDTYTSDAWQRLGRMLQRRRGELGYGFRQRARFVEQRGSSKISVKTISRLENGERDSYPESTIGTVEAMYQWSAGSIESVLTGGEPNALIVSPPSSRNPITSEDAPPTAGERLASWIYVRMSARGADDAAIFKFLDEEGFPRQPETLSAVRKISDATGAPVPEVLALLGVDDMASRRMSRPIGEPVDAAAEGDGDAAPDTFPA
jgi:hypothetical protein